MFLEPTSPTYWHIAWDAAVANLQASGKASKAPTSRQSFVGDDAIKHISSVWKE